MRSRGMAVEGRAFCREELFDLVEFFIPQRCFIKPGPGEVLVLQQKIYGDSVIISLDGYETQKLAVKTNVWQTLVLSNPASTDNNKGRPKLISVSGSLKTEDRYKASFSNETYFQIVENDFVPASKYPASGFSLNVNKASYSNVRRFINMKSEVPPDAVRVEEMINYFNLHYREPFGSDIFSIRSKLSSIPWNPTEKLLFLNVSARKLDLSKIPPANFVFLIDVSGSMDMPTGFPC